MVAIDTNVVTRLLVADDAQQHDRAVTLLEQNDVYITQSVLLEVEWVLRDAYGFKRELLLPTFQRLLETKGVYIEDEFATAMALKGYAMGVDFADAMHLASARSAKQFATFDKRLRKRAAKLEHAPEVISP